jgi:hypothetical protein
MEYRSTGVPEYWSTDKLRITMTRVSGFSVQVSAQPLTTEAASLIK